MIVVVIYCIFHYLHIIMLRHCCDWCIDFIFSSSSITIVTSHKAIINIPIYQPANIVSSSYLFCTSGCETQAVQDYVRCTYSMVTFLQRFIRKEILLTAACILLHFAVVLARKVTVSNIQLPKDTSGKPLITGEASVLESNNKYYFMYIYSCFSKKT